MPAVLGAIALAAAAMFGAAQPALAQDYPNRLVTLVVPCSAIR
jgi:tripartite-type tricarboxylate transporter receptor subunit TctC